MAYIVMVATKSLQAKAVSKSANAVVEQAKALFLTNKQANKLGEVTKKVAKVAQKKAARRALAAKKAEKAAATKTRNALAKAMKNMGIKSPSATKLLKVQHHASNARSIDDAKTCLYTIKYLAPRSLIRCCMCLNGPVIACAQWALCGC